MLLNILKLDSSKLDFSFSLQKILRSRAQKAKTLETSVERILLDVKQRGDSAVLEYTRKFDYFDVCNLSELEVSSNDLDIALENLESKRRAALEAAATRVRTFHEKQKIECGIHSWEYTELDGTVLGQRVSSLDRIGIYVPGGKASYPSSVLMNAIPAQVAGVKEIIMTTPMPAGNPNPLVLAAAALIGINRVFAIGGVQAIGALAYGTETIPAVDKIVGPGNAYVACAKRCVFGTVGIDMIAGPSEILIICDATTDPNWIAMDLFSQAEHDEFSQSILLCPDVEFISQVESCANLLLNDMPRNMTIRTALEKHGLFIKVRDLQEACDIADTIGPEHLEISTQNPRQWAAHIRHAGSIFLGSLTSESLGDYCAGPNHVLPTSRTARFCSPLGVYDFIKRSNMIEVSSRGAEILGEIASELAYAEGLQAHAKSAQLRMPKRG